MKFFSQRCLFDTICQKANRMKVLSKFLSVCWAILYLPLAVPLYLFSSWGRKRGKFERLNKKDPLSVKKACQIAFEVSSEGELEQIYPVLEHYLSNGAKVALIYSSESLEHKCQSLGKDHLKHLSLFRLPLLTHFFGNFLGGQSLRDWLSAPLLILCRYDFYPQLLALNLKFGLLGASLKGSGSKWLKSGGARLFSFIVCSSVDEQSSFKDIFDGELISLDLRMERVRKRIEESKQLLVPFGELLAHVARENRLLLGSCWPNEMELFAHPQLQQDIQEGKIQVVMAPHRLDHDFLRDVKNQFNKWTQGQIPLYVQDQKNSIEQVSLQNRKQPGVILLTAKGILCELYGLFGSSFVGGGHGRSIHSVLEPYLAMSRIYCGPKTYRSTEFTFIKKHSPKDILVVNKLANFYDSFCPEVISREEKSKRERLLVNSKSNFDRVISLIDGHME
jgi:3-deoxy-D-manno-octulosonic-acid transferase